jgi:hypothetical protein
VNSVTLPRGCWRYFFADGETVEGPVTFDRKFPLDEYPVYVREGAIIPMNISRSYTGMGDEESANYTTFLIYPHARSTFTLYDPEDLKATTIDVVKRGNTVQVDLSRTGIAHILRMYSPHKPVEVVMDGIPLPYAERWSYRRGDRRLIIKTDEYDEGHYEISYGN